MGIGDRFLGSRTGYVLLLDGIIEMGGARFLGTIGHPSTRISDCKSEDFKWVVKWVSGRGW